MRTNNNKKTKKQKPKYVIIYTKNKQDKIMGADNLDIFNNFLEFASYEDSNMSEILIYTYSDAKKHNPEFVNEIQHVLTWKNYEQIFNTL